MTLNLFSEPQQFELQDGLLRYWPEFLPACEADLLFTDFQQSLRWRQDSIKLFGKVRKIPRLQAWYADDDVDYGYSGTSLVRHDWTTNLRRLRQRIERQTGCAFNSVLANWYRDGADSMGWHADNETALGTNPVIASLTLGQQRGFKLRHQQTRQIFELPLAHGSLLLMEGTTQHFWQHSIAKSRCARGGRINLTFRLVKL